MTPDDAAERLILYGYDACYPCRVVKDVMQRMGVVAEYRDVRLHPEHRDELRRVMGRGTVPVLRIERGDEVEWLPESRDIVRYLRTRHAA